MKSSAEVSYSYICPILAYEFILPRLASKTVDIDLEKKIEALRSSQADYVELLSLASKMHMQFASLLMTQKSMAVLCFNLAVKQTELSEDFRRNAECQKAIFANGELLLSKTFLMQMGHLNILIKFRSTGSV